MIPRISTKNDIIQTSLLSRIEKSFKSRLMKNILGKALDLAKLDTPVILIGETGSGRKRMGQIIHENSSRALHPFYSFYCLDLTKEDYETAFREQLYLNDDYLSLKYNVVEKASMGILYMDQFSELSSDLMLKVIQSFNKGVEQLFRYSDAARPRLILSVNMKSYEELINTQNWKTILHMLDPHTIMIPPLRERKEDIPLLINFYINAIKSTSKKFNKLTISDASLDACLYYSWPGNIIQLHNVLLQGAVLSEGRTIENYHLPFSMN